VASSRASFDLFRLTRVDETKATNNAKTAEKLDTKTKN
jgi:hypothetical protein